jgi:aromatic-L-amino-acid decarboxylase
VKEIGTDERFRMRLDELRSAVAADRSRGAKPFLVIGNAGSVNTGAVDDLSALADLARDEGLWFHVDGAYGGFFLLTERGRKTMAGAERSDSITLDPHKSLFLPYGTGSLLVRDGDALKRAHAVSAVYLPSMQEDPDLVDFNEISPELSRSWRGLRLWLPIKMHGIGPFRENLDEKLDLARWAAEELKRIPGIEILAEPQLSITAFRWRKPGADEAELTRINRDLMNRINARKRIYLTGTMIPGERFAIRICVLSFRTHLERMREGMEDIRGALEEIQKG